MPRIGQRDFDFDRQVAVMAVINRTPDSFYDRGATFELDRAIGAALVAGSPQEHLRVEEQLHASVPKRPAISASHMRSKSLGTTISPSRKPMR